ncbi:MAG: hypothetical protein WBD24_00840 [Candidatus Omnitrophota bacterium]
MKAACFFLGWAVFLWIVCLGLDCQAFEYDSYGKRDPFVPLVGVAERASVSGARGILTVDDVSLQGIVIRADGKPAVIINGEILGEGDRIERLYVESIGNNVVTIKIDNERFDLKLYE